ncbi:MULTISPECIES: flagellar assembly peptidoglycan hydrolase FlgJ [unclassified Variovorax]|jgi:flagellar protein FlgJ|uniref:flagellar assembly peptidoglycan hydrolase FlgJ n=1 Tax=unclassified Variovorax TaxID=663243 RepID=UPI002B22EB30|nr:MULTISPECIES: flagellar assembly peptidoglycan hydrolase FlgJ [unclassified Variovorax]MEB0058549.1 flagellar assembly peptidoglycan hydrolase FlgJ [Variovorax sp. LG9.2]MEB0112026.1 flagellar assembly peptidoglycan hydrolase FlgJ [Variovorax sp. RTB1]
MAAPSSIPTLSSGGLAADARSLDTLKLVAGSNDPKAVKEAAKQFESLFMRELIKSMREATMKSGLMDSDGEKLGTDLLDQQFAVQLSGMPGGLTEAITRQLTQQMTGNARSATPTVSLGGTTTNPSATQSGFVSQHTEAAERVAQATGIPSAFMIGQAGHETGWGKSEIRNADGSNAFNLFGIKATGSWTGKVAEITTTEYVDGEAKKVTAKFRAYGSYEESFRDYAKLIGESPRYAQARAQTGSATAYATELQRAGYATDPAYAAKLSRAINTSLQLQRSQA